MNVTNGLTKRVPLAPFVEWAFLECRTPEALGKRRQNKPTLWRALSRLAAIMKFNDTKDIMVFTVIMKILSGNHEESRSRCCPLKSVNGTSCVGRSGSS